MKGMVRWLVIVLALLAGVPLAGAQGDDMAARFYFLPIEHVGNYRGPEYLPWRFDQNPVPELAGVQWSMKDYGVIDQAIVAANVTPAQHTWLESQPDVLAVPLNLDADITPGQISAFNAYLEGREIPADWLVGGTVRQGLRTVTAMFLYMQAVTAITGTSPFDTGVSLNTQIQNIPLGWRNAMQQAANQLGYDTSAFTGTTTLRQFLKGMADQWGDQPILFGFVTL